MRITIFGATGKSGQILTRKALEKDYHVIVFARNPDKLKIQHENLTVIKGDLNDKSGINQAISGSDAVISLLGPKGASKGLPISKGMQIIVESMEQLKVKRLIATATPSATDSNDKRDFRFKFAVFMIKSLIKTAYWDIVETSNIIRQSNLDWTIVRLPLLTNKTQKNKIRAGFIGKESINLFFLNRSDLADFLLEQLTDKTFIKKAPAISN